MKRSKARVFFIVSLMLMSLLVYQFLIDDTDRSGLHDRFRLQAADDVVNIELIGAEGQQLVFQKHKTGNWFLNDSVGIDALAIKDLLNALQRIRIRYPVSIEQRQQVNEDLMQYGVRIKLYAKRHWINLPGNIRLITRQKKLYDVLLGYDKDVFKAPKIKTFATDIPYEVYPAANDKNIGSFISLDLGFWRDPVVVRLLPSQIRNISVRFPANESESYELKLYADTFSLTDREENIISPDRINKQRLVRFVNAFRELTYERLVATKPGQLPTDVKSEEAFLHLSIKDVDGSSTKLSYFRRKVPNDEALVSEFRDYDPNRFYLKTTYDGFALARYIVFQPTMRPLSYFLENTE